MERGQNSLNMQLTIRISAHAMAFAQTEADGSISYEPYHTKSGVSVAANLRQAFNESRLLAAGHRSARVLVDTPVLIIPAEEFAPGRTEELYAYTFGLDKSSGVTTVEMEVENAVAAFAVNRDLRLVLDDNFKSVAVLPLMLPVWSVLHRDSYNSKARRMYAYLHDRLMEVAVFRQNHFVYSNRFEAAQAADATYFLLNVWQQLGMKAGTDELAIIGHCHEDGKLVPMASEYLSNVRELKAEDLFPPHFASMAAALPFDLPALFYK